MVEVNRINWKGKKSLSDNLALSGENETFLEGKIGIWWQLKVHPRDKVGV